MKNYHYTLFKEGPKWTVQVLDMDHDDKVIRCRLVPSKIEAQMLLDEWKRYFSRH